MDASSTMLKLKRHLMRTGTEFISEIPAATIFSSFNFHILRFSSFRFSGKGEVGVYRMYKCFHVCLDPLSRYPAISPPGSFATKRKLAIFTTRFTSNYFRMYRHSLASRTNKVPFHWLYFVLLGHTL